MGNCSKNYMDRMIGMGWREVPDNWDNGIDRAEGEQREVGWY